MIDFIMWLIFGRGVPVTPNKIDVTQDCLTIIPKSPMVVRGGGAGIVVELDYLPKDHWPAGMIDRLNKVKLEFPPGRLTATVYRADSTSVSMADHNDHGVSNDFYDVALTPDIELQRHDAFTYLKICANPAISGATIYWRRIAQ